VIPGYGGGMSSAKAQLESDTRTLAWEVGRKYKLRVNTISAGPLKSRAASAIGKEAGKKTFIECVSPNHTFHCCCPLNPPYRSLDALRASERIFSFIYLWV
jgi:enoyl-[acyl-carrier-protein] reductase (NADH)